ncbi:MAG: nucleotide exchange factor GrpE [Alphaproteobacteria bacterium]|nr:nucleotide exchange factor GrpE [Alphaproteobacteria bacterium]
MSEVEHEPEGSPQEENIEIQQDAPPPGPEEIIAGLEAEVAGLKDQLLRAVAETENIRRRAAKEKQDASKFAIASLARDLLAVPDTLDRALGSIPPEVREQEGVVNVIEGMELTQRQLLGIFERHGIKPIHPMGEKFDPNFHQAMFEAPDTGQPDGTIVQILQMGYIIGDRLLRPATVGVAKGGAQNPGSPGSTVDTSA